MPVSEGASVSCTVTTWVCDVWLPQASRAVQVRRSVKFCGQLPFTRCSANVTVGTGSQASLAPTVAGGGGVHSYVASTGMPVSEGASVSCTVTTWVCDVWLPQASRAVQVRRSVKFCGQLPFTRCSANVTVGMGSQASLAPTVAGGGGVHSYVASAGMPVSEGASVSCTVTTCVCDVWLPQASRAVQVR